LLPTIGRCVDDARPPRAEAARAKRYIAAILVCRAVGKGVDELHDKRPKSDDGQRMIEPDEPLVATLKAHRKAQTEWRLAIGSGRRELDLKAGHWNGLARLREAAP
jgi:hypothetical protein